MTSWQPAPEPGEESPLGVPRLDFAVAPTRADGQTPVTVAGELDHGSHAALLHGLSACIAAGRHRLLLDVSGVTFCDSTGLGALVRLHRQAEAQGGWLRLVRPAADLRRILQVTNLDRLLRVDETSSAATKEVDRGMPASS